MMLVKVFILTVMLHGSPEPETFYYTGLAACGDTGERIETTSPQGSVIWWHCLSSEFLEVY